MFGGVERAGDFTLGRKLVLSGTACVTLLAVLAVLAGAAEALLRAVAPQSDSIRLGAKLQNSARVFGLRPHLRTVQTGVLVETNALGFREREYPLARTPGARRIAVLGDSFTFGVGVEFAETFSKRLEAQLNHALGPHEVINFGVSAYNTTLELATLREVAAKFRPDLVIVGYVLNDAQPIDKDTKGGAGGRGGAARSLVNEAHVRLKNASMLYRWLTPKFGAVMGMLFNARYAVGGTNQVMLSFADDSPGWAESRQALLDIRREARALGADTLVVIFPAMIDFATYPVASIHEKVARFCADHGIAALDLLPRFRGENAAELAVPFDGHPNAAAHKIFAAEIYRHLARASRKNDL